MVPLRCDFASVESPLGQVRPSLVIAGGEARTDDPGFRELTGSITPVVVASSPPRLQDHVVGDSLVALLQGFHPFSLTAALAAKGLRGADSFRKPSDQ